MITNFSAKDPRMTNMLIIFVSTRIEEKKEKAQADADSLIALCINFTSFLHITKLLNTQTYYISKKRLHI